MQPRVIIITGASSGIGAEVARRLGRDGERIVLAARRADRLKQVAGEVERAGGRALAVQTDVTRQADLQRLLDATLERWGRVDVLFNNAGIGNEKPFSQMDAESIEHMLRTDLLSVIQCTRLILPVMVRQKSGHVINTASLAGLVGLPGSSLYCASKWGMVGFSDALRREMLLLRTNVYVSAFCPGFVPSEINPTLQAHAEGKANARRVPGLMTPAYVADQVAWLTRHPRRIFMLPKSWRILILVNNLFPYQADLLIKKFVPKDKFSGM